MVYWLIEILEAVLRRHDLYKFVHVFHQSLSFRIALAMGTAFLIVLIAAPKTIRFLIRKKLGDRPEFDHETLNEITRDKKNTPTMGGLLIVGAILIAVGLWGHFQNWFLILGVFCLCWLAGLGGVDDWLKLRSAGADNKNRDGLKMWEKLVFQIALGVLLGYFIHTYGRDKPEMVALNLPFYKYPITLGYGLFAIITVIVVTGTSNAVNLTDGMDGLATGCMAIAAGAFLILAYIAGNAVWSRYLLLPYIPGSGELAVLCGAMVGACAGFLWYNCKPASVFRGDTGSLPLGGTLGVVAIVIRQEVLLFIVGGIFVFEAVSVLLQVGSYKLFGGKRVFRCAPIHHHFQLGGWSEPQTVTRFWLLAGMCAMAALASIKLR